MPRSWSSSNSWPGRPHQGCRGLSCVHSHCAGYFTASPGTRTRSKDLFVWPKSCSTSHTILVPFFDARLPTVEQRQVHCTSYEMRKRCWKSDSRRRLRHEEDEDADTQLENLLTGSKAANMSKKLVCGRVGRVSKGLCCFFFWMCFAEMPDICEHTLLLCIHLIVHFMVDVSIALWWRAPSPSSMPIAIAMSFPVLQ